MPSPVRIKFKASIPLYMEVNLVQKHGFVVHSRKKNEWVIFEKKDFTPKITVMGDITPLAQKGLLNRIDKIINWYDVPEQHTHSIRLRLTSLAAGFDPKERKFIQDWTDENYPAAKDVR